MNSDDPKALTHGRIVLEHHVAAVALYFLHYNFARIHQSLRVAPAMGAGVPDHVWEIEKIVALLGRK